MFQAEKEEQKDCRQGREKMCMEKFVAVKGA